MVRALSVLAGCFLLVVGCNGYEKYSSGSASQARSAATSADKPDVSSAGRADPSLVFSPNKPGTSPTVESATLSSAAANAAHLGRKIVYIADVSLVVPDFARTESELPKLVRQAGGYLGDVSIDRSRGQQLAGRWMARIPVDGFESFLNSLSTLGVPESRHQTAQDISEEFVDLEARIKNSKRLEERILKLADERTGNLRDVADAEQQLSRVREEIERMEGHLRYLSNRAALTTVTINAREEVNYKPPEVLSFTARLGQSWRGSLTGVKESGESLLVASASAAPWLAIWVVFLTPTCWLLFHIYRRTMAARRAAIAAAAQPAAAQPAASG